MTGWADLHLHSRFSDGAETPETVMARAAAAELKAVALTDHDTVAGTAEARRAAASRGLEYLNGVELSALFRGLEVHIVGLGIDPDSPALQQYLAQSTAMRRERVRRMLEKLAKSGVFTFSGTDAPGPSWTTRMQVAVAMKQAGKADSVQQAFDRHLNRGRRAYVPKCLPDIAASISVIHEAGGLAFLAHPGLGKFSETRFLRLLEHPFDGIEAWHPGHSREMVRRFISAAEHRGLLLSGGSDCHGGVKGDPPLIGGVKIPYAAYARIVTRLS